MSELRESRPDATAEVREWERRVSQLETSVSSARTERLRSFEQLKAEAKLARSVQQREEENVAKLELAISEHVAEAEKAQRDAAVQRQQLESLQARVNEQTALLEVNSGRLRIAEERESDLARQLEQQAAAINRYKTELSGERQKAHDARLATEEHGARLWHISYGILVMAY